LGLVEVILLFKLAPKCGTEVVWYSQAQEGCGGPWGEMMVQAELSGALMF